jgi:hypothetical protein
MKGPGLHLRDDPVLVVRFCFRIVCCARGDDFFPECWNRHLRIHVTSVWYAWHNHLRRGSASLGFLGGLRHDVP